MWSSDRKGLICIRVAAAWRSKTGNHKQVCWIESRRAGGKMTPSHRFWLFARCDGARNSVTHCHFELGVVCRFKLHINIPSGCRSLCCGLVFFYLVLSFLFCIDLLSGNTQRIKYASGLDVSAEHPFFFFCIITFKIRAPPQEKYNK